ncbi:MAG: acyl-CoA dehydratase activase [Spirochaetales bacterium]|uniref:Acyl-CoA dehydratase activase n=1 Tax=Candidatus Thalassospirochaeta sargassi TaxID=3119039 RepID=A0AAJ1IES9_9SPIO|nr:acyl-CoA dehydratase activase [Spirochaetales bacterium]
MQNLGINIGSSSLKLVMLDDGKVSWSSVLPHEGDFVSTLKKSLEGREIASDAKAIVTGTEGRYLFNINSTIETVCIESALNQMGDNVDAVVSMGGEDLTVYTIDENNKIINNFTGSKCASGTGEFFKQQLGRMDMVLEDVKGVNPDANVLSLSARCSVFMKSDCTHRLNKREATKDDIVLSLSDVMATKVIDFLNRARIKKGKVLLAGGLTLNQFILRFIKEKAPEIEFIVPEEASYFEAYGAAFLAEENGSPMPAIEKLLKDNKINFPRYEKLSNVMDKVTYFQSDMGKVAAGKEYVLGVDGGSTTTKACLIDIETNQIVAEHYGRTHGDPVKALKGCIVEIKKKIKEDIGDEKIKISLASTTGSSREILGVFLETSGVYNEIIAHAYGTTYFSDDVDTIFEIGGQDAKYVLLNHKVPIDYAMNEACSAGTGSFLEESASGDLNIKSAAEIGDIAIQAESPLKFGEHCSAFINSDIRKAIQQGAGREDITAGIVTSIVSNYLNRVVGNRTIGNKIFLQGGVAKNKAIPLAFAMMVGKEILVPPSPELMGCFGVGLLAKQKFEDGLLEKGVFDLDAILDTEIVYEKQFRCKACENDCPIQVLQVNGHKYMFGGRCSKYTNSRKKIESSTDTVDFVQKRSDLLFKECAADPETFVAKRDYTVGIPRAFSVHTLYPLYSWFFHTLGIKTVMSDKIAHEGVARCESTYCFPSEIAHGAVQDVIDKGCDYIFLPHFRDMPSYEADVHANFCPITQGLPYYIKKAFPEVAEDKILELVVSFKFGEEKALELFQKFGKQLDISEAEIKNAFKVGVQKQEEFLHKLKELGLEALEYARNSDKPVITLLGRPYNAFTREANMGIPKKFTSKNFSVIPYDILPFENEEIYDNMYWYYGQQDMKAARMIKEEDNIYATWISNFSCAPDSFMLHYLKWIMGTKPFLILELDSHSADAGVDTRVEAFLDIIEGYRNKIEEVEEERYDNGLRFRNDGNLYIENINNGEKMPILNNDKIEMIVSNMGEIASELVATALTAQGFNARSMPVADAKTLEYARNYCSGKECVPSQLVLGGALKFMASSEFRKDKIYALFVPITTGPCRTGQYFVFYENLFKDLKIDNVVVFTLSADNSYNELGPGFSQYVWKAVTSSDYLKDMQTTLRACAENPKTAMIEYKKSWKKVVKSIGENLKSLYPALEQMGKEMAEIPLKRNPLECPKVLVVGEIFVRRDDFAVDELIENFASKGIIAKVSSIAEWIHYTDFVRDYDVKKRIKLKPAVLRPFCKETREWLFYQIEKKWKSTMEHKALHALNVNNLVPSAPHDMNKIMKTVEENFVNLELNSEIAVSSGSAATAMEEGYSGVVNISPFACLIGRVIQGIYTPWARERNFPTMSVEVDGNQLPPNILNQLNIFMLNVLRFKHDMNISDLVEDSDSVYSSGLAGMMNNDEKEKELINSK